jgi:hypothetical protein
MGAVLRPIKLVAGREQLFLNIFLDTHVDEATSGANATVDVFRCAVEA